MDTDTEGCLSAMPATLIKTKQPSPRTTFQKVMEGYDPGGEKSVTPLLAMTVFNAALPFIDNFDVQLDTFLLEKLCRYIHWSLEQESPQLSYIACGFLKDNTLSWIEHLKHLLTACLTSMSKLRPELVADSKLLSVFLSTVVNLTTIPGWKIIYTKNYKALEPGMAKLSRNLFSHMMNDGNLFGSIHEVLEAGLARPGKIALKKANLQALATLAKRPLIDNKSADIEIEEKHIINYIRQILTVPAYVYYVQTTCPEGLDISIFPTIIHTLEDEEKLYSCILDKDLSIILSLLANLIHLGENCEETEVTNLFHSGFAKVIRRLMFECAAKNEQVSKSHWHPVLGYVSRPIPTTFLNAASAVKLQIQVLWGPRYIQALFSSLFQYLEHPEESYADNMESLSTNLNQLSATTPSTSAPGGFKTGLLKVWRKITFVDQIANRKHGGGSGVLKFNSAITIKLANVCQLYSDLISKFPLCRLDILTGLCFKQSSKVVSSLWAFFQKMGNDCGLRGWIDIILSETTQIQESLIRMLADTMIHFVTILDDQEMYDEENVFKLEELAQMCHFVNNLCYRLISHHNHGRMKPNTWASLKLLLMVLYRRDCRRKYCPDEHWLIESSKMGHLISDIEKGRKNAKRILLDMPHVLREDARVILFRKWATSEKTLNGNTIGEHELGATISGSALITIQRGRIVEDGYANLANLSPKALKGTIRVRFQNELGLDEAGIDQDGVFKEFLEETIKAVFNPSLNLFKATSENLLYPSPLSYLHENHLELFEFVGKMLAKAVYEGIVVDVHFAPFFLSQILGLQQSAWFSAIDEVQFLDRELYNSLSYLKHYQGNVQELELTFSVDQDVLGEIRTTELIPGGRTIPVTNDNKINYLYLMAYFHLYTQIKDPTAAFLKGFRSIIPNEWLRIFSIPELQRLISGEDSDIDLVDLRRNTQYYGGFHDNHRVIGWLWEILDSDFTEEERRLFLKFVTSCSKPPLLGFMNLDPPFSIRCVEVSDDDDTGDTIGSVLRGFLAMGKKEPIGRLPTSSTCFNLLKLPNYQKKSTLRDKLKYAVTANVGFELS